MEKIKILLVENIHSIAKLNLEAEGFEVDLISYAPAEDELCKLVTKYQAVGIRSKTEFTEKALRANPNLYAVGAFCIGTNQINLIEANNFGIPVFNAPHSNTRSVAEMVLAEMIILARKLGDRNNLAHNGGWLKSAEGSHEIRGKTLGIIGYGHIGSQLSILAEALGLKVIFFDTVKKLPLGNAQPCKSIEELLSSSDFVTLHVPETNETKEMISSKELKQMKKGSYLINASRGSVVVIEDLFNSLKSEHLGGAAIDVFPLEPSSNKEKFSSKLQGLPNVFLTPHVGAKESIHINPRVIVASNQPLEDLVKKNLFRDDLRFRLSGKIIKLFPLRERKEEIPDFVKHFASLSKPRVNKYFSPEAIDELKNHPWPGNVRELKRICEQLLLTSPLPVIRESDVKSLLKFYGNQTQPTMDLNKGLDLLTCEFEAEVIKKALAEFKEIDKICEVLKISRSSLYKKIKDYSLSEP